MSDARWTDMAAAWVLGALDADEAREFEARLEHDAELRAEVRVQRELLGALADVAPRHSPPASLKARIMAEARSSRPESAATPEAAGTPPADGPRLVREESPAQGPGYRASDARPLAGFWFFRTLAAAATIAAIALAVSNRQLSERIENIETDLRTAETQVDETADLLADREELLASFLGPDVRTATLASTGAEPSARVFFNASTGGVVVTAFGLPPAPEGRVYQLWGIAEGGTPVSLGTFQTGGDGTAIVQATAPVGADFAISAVTEEPVGGSPQPTTTPFLVGTWSSD